jgi:hypothetical protein
MPVSVTCAEAKRLQNASVAAQGRTTGVLASNTDFDTPSKYRARRTACSHGHTHDSKKEALRCDELHLLCYGGEIDELQCQVSYKLIVNGFPIAVYRADFVYHDRFDNLVVEDVKGGPRTREYVIKRKLMMACYQIAIKET